MNLPETLRRKVAERAAHCCEYCRMPEAFLATNFHVDHIRSIKHGGKTSPENLAFACPHCNQHKGSDVATFLDESDEQPVRFFNPRKDHWPDHFANVHGEIIGLTPVGAATVRVLNMNQPERIMLRQALMAIGRYPA